MIQNHKNFDFGFLITGKIQKPYSQQCYSLTFKTSMI